MRVGKGARAVKRGAYGRGEHPRQGHSPTHHRHTCRPTHPPSIHPPMPTRPATCRPRAQCLFPPLVATSRLEYHITLLSQLGPPHPQPRRCANARLGAIGPTARPPPPPQPFHPRTHTLVFRASHREAAHRSPVDTQNFSRVVHECYIYHLHLWRVVCRHCCAASLVWLCPLALHVYSGWRRR